MARFWTAWLAGGLLLGVLPVHADEAPFLASLQGKWSGKGSFRLSTGASPVGVSCAFTSTAAGSALKLDGSCRGMILVSRAIGVTLKAAGARYSGTYAGSTTGPAGLSGRRAGERITLNIRWAKPVNGDRDAEMRVEKTGANTMRISTIDRDPKTGKSVVTSEIRLTR